MSNSRITEAYAQTTTNPSQVFNILSRIPNSRLYCNYDERKPKQTAVAYVSYKNSIETTDVPYRVFFAFLDKYKDDIEHTQQGEYIHIYTKKDKKDMSKEQNTNESLNLTESFDADSISQELSSQDNLESYVLKIMGKPIFREYYYKIKGRKDAGKRTNVKAITNEEKYICYCIISAMLSYDELKQQLLNHPSCPQNPDVIKLIDLVDGKIRQRFATSKIGTLFESVQITEDYSDYIGKPLKDFLNTLDSKTTVNLEFNEIANGLNSYNGRITQIPWFVADRTISAIQTGDNKYYNFKIITESNKQGLIKEDAEDHRYVVVAADENSNELFRKDVKGINSAKKQLDTLSSDYLADIGATQVYIERDDGKEVYVKFSNDDGSWEIIKDDIELEMPDEERHTLFNSLLADLGNESDYFVGHLRKIPRKEKKTPGYVGFNYDEIGIDGDVITCVSPHDKQMDWAKEVADVYGFQVSPVIQRRDGRKAIKIYATGISDENRDPRLIP